MPVGQREPAARLAAPVEHPFDGEQDQGEQDEERPQLPLDGDRRRLRPRPLDEGGERPRRQVGLLGAHEVDGHARLSARGADRVDPRLVRVREARHPARDLRLDPPARRGRHGRRGHPVLDGEQDGLARRQREARLIEAGRVQPPEALRQHEREGHAQREIGLEQVEAEEHGLSIPLFERVHERTAHGLHQGLARGERAHPHGVFDRDLREVELTHDGVRPVPVHDDRVLETPEHLERHVGRDRVHEHEAPVADARGARGVDDDDVGPLHAALILLGLLHLELDLGVGLEGLLEEQIAGAHEGHGDLALRRQHRIGDIVGGEVVGHVQAQPHDPSARIGERHDDGAAHRGLEGQRLLGQRLAVERERQREGLRLRREVGDRHERLRVERAEVVPPYGQAGDADIAAAPSDADPADPHVVTLGLRRRGVGPVGEDVDLGPGIRSDERARRPDSLAEAVGQIVTLQTADPRGHLVVIAGEGHDDARLDAGLDHHDLGALAEPAQQTERFALRLDEPRRPDIRGLHGRRAVHDDRHPLVALPRHRDRRPREGRRQGEQGEDLEDEQRIALQPLKEGRGLAVPQGGIPEQQARHRHLAAPHLEEIQEEQRDGEPSQGEGERTQKAHDSRSPLSWRSTNSSTGVSVTTRW